MIGFKKDTPGIKRQSLASTAMTALVVSAALGIGATPAFAQTETPAADEGDRLEDIVVTARKRDENIDIVPLAITAMTAETIENRNIDSLEDVSSFTPGFYTQSQTGTGTGRNDRSFRQLTFRGIGANSTNVGPLAGGVAFLDGSPVLNSSLSNVQDVERVEVLRGPQSAYFGRSTFIGAVNYITKDPTDEWEGRVTAEIGEDNLFEASFSVSGPIIADVLSFRISGRRYERDGQYVTANSGVRLGDQSTDSISLTLLFEPSDNFRMRTFFNHFEDDDGPSAQYYVGGRTIGAGGSNCNLGGTLGPYNCGPVPQRANPAAITANVSVNQDIFNGVLANTTRNVPIPFDYADFLSDYGLVRKADQFSHRMDYTFGDNGPTLTSLTAYHEEKIVTLADLAFRVTPTPLAASVGYEDYDWSQELRLVSGSDQRFRWVIGGNYLKLEQSTSGIIGFYPPFGGILNFGNAQVGYTRAETPSVFGGVYFDVLSDLTLTVEARYQEDKLSGHYATSATTFVDISETYDSFSPRVSVDYRLTPTSTVYALFSRGYKPGGFNNAILTQSQFVLNQLTAVGAGRTYDQERLDNFELGIRGSFADGRVRLALNGYVGRYTNAQVPIPTIFYTTMNADGTPNINGANNSAVLTRNLGDVDLQGIEFEGEVIIARGLRVGATVAYTGTELKNWFCSECSNILAQNATNNIQVTSTLGKRLPGAPEFAYTISANYESEFGNGFTGFVGADFLYRGSYFAEAANIGESGDSERFNARLGIRKDDFSVEIFARNLFNDQSPSIAYSPSDLLAPTSTGNALRIGLPERRRIGLRASLNF